MKMGCNLLIHGADISIFAKHLTDDLAEMRSAMGDAQATQVGSSEEHI